MDASVSIPARRAGPWLVLVVLLAAGCQGYTSSGGRYVIDPTRVLRSSVASDLYAAHHAARDVLEYEYLYLVERDTVDGREGVIHARTAKRHPVRIWTTRNGERLTTVRVFVGPLGNTSAAAEIFAAIERRTGVVPVPERARFSAHTPKN